MKCQYHSNSVSGDLWPRGLLQYSLASYHISCWIQFKTSKSCFVFINTDQMLCAQDNILLRVDKSKLIIHFNSSVCVSETFLQELGLHSYLRVCGNRGVLFDHWVSVYNVFSQWLLQWWGWESAYRGVWFIFQVVYVRLCDADEANRPSERWFLLHWLSFIWCHRLSYWPRYYSQSPCNSANAVLSCFNVY